MQLLIHGGGPSRIPIPTFTEMEPGGIIGIFRETLEFTTITDPKPGRAYDGFFQKLQIFLRFCAFPTFLTGHVITWAKF